VLADSRLRYVPIMVQLSVLAGDLEAYKRASCVKLSGRRLLLSMKDDYCNTLIHTREVATFVY